MLIILAFKRLKQEDLEFVVNLGFLVRAGLHWATQDPKSKELKKKYSGFKGKYIQD